MITPLPVPPVPVHAAALPAASRVSTKLEKDTVYMPSNLAAAWVAQDSMASMQAPSRKQ